MSIDELLFLLIFIFLFQYIYIFFYYMQLHASNMDSSCVTSTAFNGNSLDFFDNEIFNLVNCYW